MRFKAIITTIIMKNIKQASNRAEHNTILSSLQDTNSVLIELKELIKLL